MDGAADVAETAYTPFQSEPGAAPVRLIVRRVKPTPGSQLALFATYSYHAFITDRDGEMLELEADHRRHAEIENAIRDLKYGVGLNHLPSGRFAANAAWRAVQVLARPELLSFINTRQPLAPVQNHTDHRTPAVLDGPPVSRVARHPATDDRTRSFPPVVLALRATHRHFAAASRPHNNRPRRESPLLDKP